MAPWESLISMARTGADADLVHGPGQVEGAGLGPAAEVAGADLPDQLAAVAVVVGDAALTGGVQAAGAERRRG